MNPGIFVPFPCVYQEQRSACAPPTPYLQGRESLSADHPTRCASRNSDRSRISHVPWPDIVADSSLCCCEACCLHSVRAFSFAVHNRLTGPLLHYGSRLPQAWHRGDSSLPAAQTWQCALYRPVLSSTATSGSQRSTACPAADHSPTGRGRLSSPQRGCDGTDREQHQVQTVIDGTCHPSQTPLPHSHCVRTKEVLSFVTMDVGPRHVKIASGHLHAPWLHRAPCCLRTHNATACTIG